MIRLPLSTRLRPRPGRRLAFTGGMNIGDEYGSSRRQRPDAWRDTQVEVEGPAAALTAIVAAAYRTPPG